MMMPSRRLKALFLQLAINGFVDGEESAADTDAVITGEIQLDHRVIGAGMFLALESYVSHGW